MAEVEAGSTPVLIGPAAASLRRALPASAWVALECLVARSRPSADGRVVELGVRDLAADIGGSKNTAQRALAGLTVAGLVSAEHMRQVDGTFCPTRYLLHLPTDVLDPVPPRPNRRTRPTPSTDTPDEPPQLSLLGT
jgi:DNA-binding transcriptional ArsR family regulator